VLRALTGPDLGIAYVICREGDRFISPGAGWPVRVNLEDGTLAAMTDARDPNLPQHFHWGSFEYAALSPDGKWLFADGGALVRYRIEDTKLTLDATSHVGMGGGAKLGICVSPDSQWVCFPTGGGNDGLLYGTYVYRADDLSRPAFTLKQGAYPMIVGFDPVGKHVLSQDSQPPLMVFDQNGTKRGEYKFGTIRGSHDVKQYAPHPKDGRSLLLRSNEHLLLVEFAEAEGRGRPILERPADPAAP